MESENRNSGQYLTFIVEKRIFAFEVLSTREVLSYLPITPLPDTPEYVAGLVKIRETALPVIDIRKKFGMISVSPTEDSAIIVIEVLVNGTSLLAGILVDMVRGVIRLEPDMIDPPPRLGEMASLDLLQGIGKVGNDFILILRTSRLLSGDDLSLAETICGVPDKFVSQAM